MCGNGAEIWTSISGIATPTTAADAMTAAAAGTTTPTTARWATRAGTTPVTPTSTWASALSATQVSNGGQVLL